MSTRIRLPIAHATSAPAFAAVLEQHRLRRLQRAELRTLQVNVGKLCNMACQHCHVEAGPKRPEIMLQRVAARVLELLARDASIDTVDITGGAPELNPSFRWLVQTSRELGRKVIDRCNLSVLLEPATQGLAEFLAAHEVRIVASLPCYRRENVDRQRGSHAFERSIEVLRHLNTLGYGKPGSALELDLVYNPGGAFLPPAQATLEAAYKQELGREFGIEFHHLLTLANMPIKRFAQFLERTGELESYVALLAENFNPNTVPGVMCRSLVSVGWDGRLYDCDFNQMLDLELGAGEGKPPRTVWDIDSFAELAGEHVTTAAHCFGCTAGAGSSCGGALQ